MTKTKPTARACCSSTTIRMRARCTASISQFSGFDVVEAANGMEALQRAVDETPDIILMDLSLPVMDGWEATRRLKADERTADIPVVALTGHALAGISEGAQKAGCDAFVTKPCLPEDLVKEIRKVLDQPSASAAEEEPAGAENMRKPSASAAPVGAAAPPHRRSRAGSRRRRPRRPRRRARRNGARCDRPTPRRRRASGRGARPNAAIERIVQRGGRPRSTPSTAGSRGKYVYCIIEATDPLKFGPIGIGADPSDVYTVHYQNLAAVVSDAPLEVLDSTRENVLAHERVNETVMREHTVIPMSFGTIFKTREDIVELLRSAAEAFGDVLNKMQNKLEFGLKVLWDRDQAIREVEGEDDDIGRLKKEISGQKGPTYFARMQYGRLVDAALQSRSERYVAEILDELRDVSVASRINKPIGDKMIMNAAFLISRDRESAFDSRGEVDRQPLRQADVQVHWSVAAVQLRQHPAEAGASLTVTCDRRIARNVRIE